MFLSFGLCIFFTLVLIMDKLSDLDKSYDDNLVLYEFYAISKIFDCIFILTIDSLILYTFLLLSNKVEEEMVTKITNCMK